MNTRGLALLCTATLAVLGCGDDGGGSGDSDGTASDSSTVTPGDDGVDDGVDDGGTTVGSADTMMADSTDDGMMSSTGDSDGSSSGDEGSSTGGMGFDCSSIPAGPFTAEVQFMPAVFSGSEDLAFDGSGSLTAKNGDSVRVVDASGAEVALHTDMGPAYGLRYRNNGDVLIAHFMSGNIVQIDPAGRRSNFATGYGGVNGIYPDLEDRVWLTDFSVVGRINADGSYQDIVTGSDAAAANGIVYDPDRGFAFFTNYGQGRIRKVAIDDAGEPGAVSEVAVIGGTSPDGLSLDICGNLYVVDQGGSRLYRVMLDANAEALGEAENLLDGGIQNIANAQFGRGGDFDELSLYAAGTPGVVYRVEVGVPGANIPLPGA